MKKFKGLVQEEDQQGKDRVIIEAIISKNLV